MTTIVTIDMGGTGATHAAGARSSLAAAHEDAYAQANAAYAQANSAYSGANNARVTVFANNGVANSTTQNVNFVNAASILVSVANNSGNADISFSLAGTPYDQANNAYAAANNSNLKLGGVISGTLNVTQDVIVGGNIYLGGNTTFINVSTYSIEDSLIYLAANNTLTDSVDIGFVGAKNVSGTFSHTGLARDATDGKYKLFDNLADSGHVGNVIDFANTSLATLVANVEANSITLVGNTVATQANLTLAHNQANAAYGQANAAYGAANNRVLKAGDTMTGQLNISSGGLLVTGNVGVGTATPSTLFNIYGGTSGNKTDLFAISHPANAGAQPVLRFDTVPINNNVLGRISVKDAGSFAGEMVFEVSATKANGSSTTTERMIIKGDGNVAIGTSTAGQRLTVNGAIETLVDAGGGVNEGGQLILRSPAGGNTRWCIDNYTNKLRIFREDDTTLANGAAYVYIVNGGNIGIGTENPSVNLHITQAVPSGVGSVPSGTGVLLENTGNNYITFRHSADAAKYSGIVFLDNNIGGYVVHGDGGTGDKLYIAGYGGVEIQQGTSSSVTPGARTTIGNFTSSGLTVTGTITETSSIRIKENINPITDALEKVLSMNGYTYDRIDGTAKQRAGLIAEEINEIIPNVVQKDAEGLPYGIQYTNIIAYLVEAIKELKTEINDLKKGV